MAVFACVPGGGGGGGEQQANTVLRRKMENGGDACDASTTLADVLRVLPQLCELDDAWCCALASVACRNAMHELLPLCDAGTNPTTALPLVFRFSTSIVGCVRSVTRLEWARLAGAPWEPRDYLVAAARQGFLDVCEALFPEVSAPRIFGTDRAPADVCRAAAFGGHVHVLEVAHRKGFPWDGSCCAAAAAAGDLDTLKWLLRHGCPWDKVTTCRAAVEGHTTIVDWCRANGCDYSEETMLRMKMAKMSLAIRNAANSPVHIGENGVVMVTRHAAMYPAL